jgi:hypothetical protein
MKIKHALVFESEFRTEAMEPGLAETLAIIPSEALQRLCNQALAQAFSKALDEMNDGNSWAFVTVAQEENIL